jgi:predicted amidophosphoribosyltransferase
MPTDPRKEREQQTLSIMLSLYCRGKHSSAETLCPACKDLQDYAEGRIRNCSNLAKTTCFRCTVHCYPPELRAKIREVMRYAGPRMLWRHPILALQHLLGRK